VPAAVIDLDRRVIPNALVAVGAVAGLALVLAVDRDHLAGHLLAAVGAGGGFLLVAVAAPSGMGMGDVKLAALLGLYLGASVVPALLVALASGAAAGAAIVARRGLRAGRKAAIPFGPFLALGGVVGLLAGPALTEWYLRAFAGG
jgi:leader peptidase (prepilin peptidase)/N-methyltransferase